MKLLNWNTEWAVPGRVRGRRVQRLLEARKADLACLTEAYPEILPADGHTITSTDNSGYDYGDDRRKVVLWSREAWRDEWHAEAPGRPGGRFVTGITAGLRVVGVCIPWHMAHVNTGQKNRKQWEEHFSYLEFLGPILDSFLEHPEPLLVVGDWNQPIPRPYWLSTRAHDALMHAIPAELQIVTANPVDGLNEDLIDHLAVGCGIDAQGFDFIDRRGADDKPLSDHLGYTVNLQITPAL